MNVLFVTGEVAPFASDGDHGEAVVTLAKVLRRASDHKVTIVSPLFASVDPTANSLARRLTKLAFSLGGQDVSCELYTGRNADGTELAFIGHDTLASTERIESSGKPIDATRAGVFSSAVVEMLNNHGEPFDLIHGHGWVGACALAKVRDANADIATVLTVYDAELQGQFEPGDVEQIGLDAAADGNAMRAGLVAADHIIVLSSNYAKRLAAGPQPNDLHHTFAELHGKTNTIRHGIDSAIWNPTTDPLVPARFDPFSLDGKATCKAELQHELALPVRGNVPVFAAIGRTKGDGMEVLAQIGEDFLRNDVQWVVHLEGDGELVATFEELWDQYPDGIQIKTGSDATFVHRLVSGADFVVVPGRDAPTANLQMCAQRYGALPIVRRDSGLADEVVDCDPTLTTGSGFLYEAADPKALSDAMKRAVAAFEHGAAFSALQSRTMRFDHSWDRTARLYERVYDNAVSQASRSVA